MWLAIARLPAEKFRVHWELGTGLMHRMLKIEKFSLGIGDRFGREGLAQIRAIQAAQQAGVQIAPVWNKSNREHSLIGSEPGDTRAAG